jgi:hypothetical protein
VRSSNDFVSSLFGSFGPISVSCPSALQMSAGARVRLANLLSGLRRVQFLCFTSVQVMLLHRLLPLRVPLRRLLRLLRAVAVHPKQRPKPQRRLRSACAVTFPVRWNCFSPLCASRPITTARMTGISIPAIVFAFSIAAPKPSKRTPARSHFIQALGLSTFRPLPLGAAKL